MHNVNLKVWGYRLLWACLIAAYLIIPWGHLGDYARNYDEGPQLQAAALVHEGYPLYSEVVVNKPPLMSWWVALGFEAWGMTIEAGRLTMLFTALIGFVSLGVLAEQWWGQGGGVLAMVLFLALPEVPERVLYVMNDLPAMSMALAAVVAATSFRKHGAWVALVLSGLMYALAILFHPLLFYMAVPILMVLFYPRKSTGFPLFKSGSLALLWGGVAIVVTVLMVVPVDLQGLLTWVFGYNLNLGLVTRVSENWTTLWGYWQGLPLILLALAGVSAMVLTSAASRNRLWVGVLAAWFYLAVGVLYMLRPLWPHYCLFTLYPAVLLAAGGIVTAWQWVINRSVAGPGQAWQRWMLAGLLGAGVVGFSVGRLQERVRWKLWSEPYYEARLFLEEACEPKEFIISDNQFLAFAAGCLVPPSLADTSGKRIETGMLTESEVIDNLLRYQVRYLSIGTTRLRTQINIRDGINLLASSEWHFDRTFIYHIDRDLLVPAHKREALVGDAIRLQGYRLEGAFKAGEKPLVILFWESAAPVSEDWTVFVHLFDASGNLVAQHDGPPFMGGAATSTWRSGYQILDPHPLELSQDLAPGTYQILVGMYRVPTFARLPAVTADVRWPDDAISLTEISIE